MALQPKCLIFLTGLRESSISRGIQIILQISLAFLVLSFGPYCPAQQGTDQAQAALSPSLEVRLTTSLRWEKGCLHANVDRINQSSKSLFLPIMGLYISTSVAQSKDGPAKDEDKKWINVYGATDILSWDATPIAPGSTVHNDLCLDPTIAVVNLQKKTRREIPLRGRLKIEAYYFLTREDWLKNKSQNEEMMRNPPKEWGKIEGRIEPGVSTAIVAIPCQFVGCTSGCTTPPLILDGENSVIPDVAMYDMEWNARGKAINDELEPQSPPCSKADPQ